MIRSCALLLAALLMAPLTSAAQTPRKRPAPPAPAAAKPALKPAELPKPVPPDLEITTVHTTGDTKTTSTVQLKGARARITVAENLASVLQCDAGQTFQLNTQTRTYLATPATAPTGTGKSALDTRRKGGQVIYTTAVTDTGETQDMFGFTARHLKTTVSRDATLDACDTKPERIDTDGWYIDLPATLSCTSVPATPPAIQVDPQHPDCVDEVRYKRSGAEAGYPVKYTTVSTTADRPPLTTTMEVSRLERREVPASAVEIPDDYIEVHTVSQLTADHRPGEPGVKKPGAVRIGLVPLGNRSTAQLETGSLNEALLESFSDTDLDIVRVAGSTPAELEADAKAKEVDLLLNSTIAEVKTPRGGIMSRVNGSSADAFSARVEYALIAPGQAKPRHAGSERSGGSSLTGALTLARKVVQFAPPLMMAKYGYMNAYGSMLTQSGASGAMRQTQDPVVNMALSLVDRAAKKTPAEQYATEEAAVASALEKVIRSVVSDIGKGSDAGKTSRWVALYWPSSTSGPEW